jgi:hypothetical protein
MLGICIDSTKPCSWFSHVKFVLDRFDILKIQVPEFRHCSFRYMHIFLSPTWTHTRAHTVTTCAYVRNFVGWDWVHSVRRPLMVLMYQPRMIDEYGAFGGMRVGRGKPEYSEKTCPSATLSITNLTWPGIKTGPPRWETDEWPPELWHGRVSNVFPCYTFYIKIKIYFQYF